MRVSALSIDIRAVAAYLMAIVLSTGLLIGIMDLRSADLRIPFSYGGDALLGGSLIKGLIDNGWYLHNSYIGIPEGQYLYDYPVNANLDIMIMKIISLFGANYAMTINIYFLLTFILTTITTMLVLRHFRVSYLLSILGSLLFSFVPYHFLRGEGHLFLAAYYMIPPIVMVILWVSTSTSFLLISSADNIAAMRLLNSKSVMCIVICVLISSAFIYYPFFSCFFLLIAGITGYISQHNKYPLLNSLILISIIILGVLVNTSPSLIYQHENGKNPEVAVRYPMESEIYGLKISQLLMPINGHRIPLLARLSSYYSNTAPLVNENSSASLGLIGSIGFLILIAWAFYRISNGSRSKAGNILNELNALSMLNLSAVLLATLGGFGSLFAYLIFPEIRSYNRISIFIAFFSLFAITLFLEEFSRKCIKGKTSRLLFNLIIGLVFVFGVLDQTSNSFVPPYASTKAIYLNDETFINNIEAIMPENAMIFQLPYMPFPECGPKLVNMTDYSHFRAYLHSKDLRWSYGAMKGRSGDDWLRLVASMPTEDMIKTISQFGFAGIYLDSYGFEDSGAKLLSNITRILEVEPVVSDNKRLYFFDMTKYNQRIKAGSSASKIMTIAFSSGFYDIENWSGIPSRWMQADATLLAYAPESCTANMSLQALSFYRNRTLEMYADNDLLARSIVSPSNFVDVAIPVHLSKGENLIRFHVPEGCEKPSDKPELKNPDSRCLSLAVQNIYFTDVKAVKLE
jgi:hypothetical protein